jgi:phosphate transport system substrate-binding protein
MVEPNLASFGAAAQSANWQAEKGNGFGIMLTDQTGAGSWPIAGATFILIHRQPKDPAAAAEALKFFAWAYAKGDKMAEDLDYLPLPQSAKAVIQQVWASEIKDANGKPVYAMAR